MSAHTPGPLHAGPETDDGTFGVLLPSGLSMGYARLEEDAKLWSASPELLSALKMVLRSHAAWCPGEECQLSGVDFAVAAIAKAEGYDLPSLQGPKAPSPTEYTP